MKKTLLALTIFLSFECKSQSITIDSLINRKVDSIINLRLSAFVPPKDSIVFNPSQGVLVSTTSNQTGGKTFNISFTWYDKLNLILNYFK